MDRKEAGRDVPQYRLDVTAMCTDAGPAEQGQYTGWDVRSKGSGSKVVSPVDSRSARYMREGSGCIPGQPVRDRHEKRDAAAGARGGRWEWEAKSFPLSYVDVALK